MKTNNQQYASAIREILSKFFSEDDIKEFSEKVFSLEPPKQEEEETGEDKVEPELDNAAQRTLVDQLLTFAELRLKTGQYINFLLELGKSISTMGELELSIDIYKEVLSSTQKYPSYQKVSSNTLLAIGDLFSRQAKWKLSFSYLRKAFREFLKQKDNLGCAKCENILGTIYGETGNLVKAKSHLENSLAYLAKSSDKKLKPAIEVNLGILNTITSDYNSALKYFNAALEFYEQEKNIKRLAEIRQNLGMLMMKTGKYDQSLKEFDTCIELSAASGYLQILEIAYLSKAYLYTRLNDFTYAEKFADNALKICCKINDRLSIADIYKIKGIINRHKSNFTLSESYFLTSLRLNRELQNKLNEAETNFELALLYKDAQRSAESKKLFMKALHYFKKINAQDEIKNIELALA